MVKRRNIWLAIFDSVFIILTVSFVVSLFFALVARWIDPNFTSFFAFFALGAPILYFVNLLILCVWLIRWSRWAIAPAVVLLFGVGNIGQYIQMTWVKNYHDTVPADHFTVMTYNVHNFISANFNANTTSDMVCRKINELNADIVVMQECAIADSAHLMRFDSLMSNYPYRVYQYNVNDAFNYNGLMILSRYSLSTPRTVSFEGTENSVIVVDIYRSRDTLRLFGCHLQTTSFNSISKERGLRSMVQSEKSDSLTRTAVAALSENFRLRALQADSLRQMIDLSPYAVVVAGDFNSPPLTYTYSTIRGDLADAFCGAGSGFGYTYKPMKKLFRIDYVLFDSDRYKAVSYLSPDLPYSDHNPVVVTLTKR